MDITTEEIREHLYGLSDAEYKKFHSSLVPGNNTILGVRVPVLRAYAKELLAQESAQSLLEKIGNIYYEERMLQGMLIGLQPKPDLKEVMEQIRKFVPKIDNWGVCDTFCAGLKIAKKYPEEMYAFIREFAFSKEVYARRFAIVMLLDYYISEAYLEQLFDIFDEIKKDDYYVQMAVAWAVSVCLVKFYEPTKEYLRRCCLDDFTYKKSIQKARESFRLTPEQKRELKNI